ATSSNSKWRRTVVSRGTQSATRERRGSAFPRGAWERRELLIFLTCCITIAALCTIIPLETNPGEVVHVFHRCHVGAAVVRVRTVLERGAVVFRAADGRTHAAASTGRDAGGVECMPRFLSGDPSRRLHLRQPD